MLHAWHIAFEHPVTGKPLVFSCPPPADFQACALSLGRVTQSIVVTGNPGSGKSTLCAMLEEAGIPCVSADGLVRDYYGPRGEASQWLVRRLGPDILDESGSVDRRALMAAFAENPGLRHETEQFCHALVLGDIRDFFVRQQQAGARRACAEIPLYFECGWNRGAFSPEPVAVGVMAGRETRSARLARDRHWDGDKIGSIESWQWDEAKKMDACRLTVQNTGTPEELRAEVRSGLLPALDALAAEQDRKLAQKFSAMYAAPMLESGRTEQDTH